MTHLNDYMNDYNALNYRTEAREPANCLLCNRYTHIPYYIILLQYIHYYMGTRTKYLSLGLRKIKHTVKQRGFYSFINLQ